MAPAAVSHSPATGLIGRGPELDRVRRLLEDGARLVTLTGPGGSGKTRLALALVEGLRDRYRDGTALIELAPLREPAFVPAAVAQALGLRESAGAQVEDALEAFVAGRELLLCIDNFEHVLEAAPLVARLLAAAPDLTVIATSRAPLRLRDEQELPVPPLLPTDAEVLFVRRASQVRPDLALENGNREAVAEICRRLDGLPLAIELAAARIRALSPPMLLQRLEERLPLLTGGPRDAPERQRTLRATIEWSYELLPEQERNLFARLSVFAGGCTLDAAEAVCDADLDTLGLLVEQNLLRQADVGDSVRYTMLETIREYAAERLHESGAEADLGGRHAEFFVALAEEADGGIYGGKQLEWLDRLDAELSNIRSALACLLEGRKAGQALRLCTAIWTLWEARRPSDGRRWLEAGLSAEDAVAPEIRARALVANGHLMLFAGAYLRARELLEAAVTLSRELGDTEALTLALSRLSWVALEQGRLDDADTLTEEGLGLLPDVEELWVRAEGLNYFGTAVAESDATRGCELLEEARALWSDLGNAQRSADVLNNLGWTTILTGEYARSRGYLEENLRVARGNRDTFRIPLALGNLGLVELLDGHPERVPLLLAEALPLMLERGERRSFPEAAVIAASVAAAAGDTVRAARLAGAGEAAYEAGGGTWSQPEQQLLDRYVLPPREEAAGPFGEAWAEGRAMSFEEAILYALEGLPESAPVVEPTRLDAGSGLAGYELEAVVGRGGMGVVWRARQVSLDRAVAIKLIAPEQAGSEAFRERFLREARLAASLEHAHVLPVYEAGESEGRLFLAMRYVEGDDLASLLAREGPLEPARAVALLTQIASALDAAHAKGLVHRDVKPANVLLVSQKEGEHAYLTDFGIAKATASETAGLTEAGQLLGTVEYLAPETIQRGEATAAADVYALACLLYELLAGTTPFARDTDVATIWAHVQEPPPPLPHTNPALAALDPVLRHGLAKEPGDRFQHARELAAAATAALAGEPTLAPPPAPAVDAWPEGLPRPPTALVGRGHELGDLAAMISGAGSPLLTITGPGGTGKTRLALELAARAAPRFEHGVHFVALAPIREPSLVASTIAQVLGLRESGTRSPEELVEQRLREAELLLLLDNVEHLVPAASRLFARLAVAADRSRLVLTSRAALGVSGEQEYPLEPLPTRDAAELFEARARAVKPSLAIDAEAGAVIASICARLDGLPLAIELAAARVRLLSPQAILKRLDERLALLVGGPADAPARQQTLRATIDWSHELLEPDQQRLFAGLSVFPGGARLEAIEAVCGGDLDALDALVRRSLAIVADDPDGEPRFSMLETIREYAAEQLEASGRAEEAQQAQATHVLELAEQAELHGPRQLEWLDRLEAEHDNLRAALAWGLERDAELAARIGAGVWEFWWARGHHREGREWLGRVIAAMSDLSLAHAVAMFGDANLARELGNEQESTQIFREVAPMFEALGDPYWLAEALLNRGCLEALLGDLDTGRSQIDRAIAMARDQHDDFLLGNALSNLGWLELQAGLMSEAAGHLEEALGAWEHAGNLWGIALAQNNLGCALVALGDVDRAEELLRFSIPASARLRMPWLVCASLDELGINVALARGDDRRAARLLGARDRLAAELGMAPTWFTSDDTVNDIREFLGADAFETAYAEGRAMSLDQIVDCVAGADSAETA